MDDMQSKKRNFWAAILSAPGSKIGAVINVGHSFADLDQAIREGDIYFFCNKFEGMGIVTALYNDLCGDDATPEEENHLTDLKSDIARLKIVDYKFTCPKVLNNAAFHDLDYPILDVLHVSRNLVIIDPGEYDEEVQKIKAALS